MEYNMLVKNNYTHDYTTIHVYNIGNVIHVYVLYKHIILLGIINLVPT